MRQSRSTMLILSVLVGGASALARQPLAGQSVAPPTVAIANLKRYMSAVADDSTMGRQSGSAGDEMAARYVAGEYRRLGLTPAGENGTYFQAVPLGTRRYDWTATVVRIGADTLVIGKDYVPSLPDGEMPWGPVRPLRGTPAVYGGVFGDSSRLIDSAAASGRLVVLALPPTAPWSATYQLSRGLPPALRGAAAVALVALDRAPAGLMPALRRGRMHLASAGTDTSETASILFISPSAAARLLGGPLDRVRIGGAGARVDGRIVVIESAPEAPAHNVVAVLAGSDPRLRATYVSLSAHHDHVGFNHAPVDHDSLHAYMDVYEHVRQASPVRQVTPEQAASIHVNLDSLRRAGRPRRDSIYNGADDDASGIAALLEIATRLSSAPARPKRSILFLAHTGEEEGLLGSTWYSDHATVPRDSIVAEMDMDMVGRGSAADLVGGGPAYLELIGSRRQSTEFGNLIDSVNAARRHPFRINYAYDAHDHPEGDWCRADHFSYARYGIPVGAFSTSYHGDYHQVTDEPQYIDFAHLAAVADFVGDLAVTVANREGRPALDRPKPADPHAACAQ